MLESSIKIDNNKPQLLSTNEKRCQFQRILYDGRVNKCNHIVNGATSDTFCTFHARKSYLSLPNLDPQLAEHIKKTNNALPIEANVLYSELEKLKSEKMVLETRVGNVKSVIRKCKDIVKKTDMKKYIEIVKCLNLLKEILTPFISNT